MDSSSVFFHYVISGSFLLTDFQEITFEWNEWVYYFRDYHFLWAIVSTSTIVESDFVPSP